MMDIHALIVFLLCILNKLGWFIRKYQHDIYIFQKIMIEIQQIFLYICISANMLYLSFDFFIILVMDIWLSLHLSGLLN